MYRIVSFYGNLLNNGIPLVQSLREARLPFARWLAKDSVTKIALLYLGAITAAELMVALVSPLAGVVFHIALLLGLVGHASLSTGHPRHKLCLVLTVAPLIRLLSLSLPLTRFPPVYWYALISIPIFIALAVVAALLGYRSAQVGLTVKRTPVQLLVMFTGVPFGVAEYLILRPSPLVPEFSLAALLLPALILLIGTGFVEELAFRGILQRTMTDVLGRWGWIYVAVLFAVLHVGYLSVLDVLFVFSVGLFFAWVVMRTGSLLGTTLSHGLTNILLYLVVPFLA